MLSLGVLKPLPHRALVPKGELSYCGVTARDAKGWRASCQLPDMAKESNFLPHHDSAFPEKAKVTYPL